MIGMTMGALSRRAFLLTSAALAACGGGGDDTSDFAATVQRWTEEIVRPSPEIATRLALPESLMGGPYETRLDDRSADAQMRARGDIMRQAQEARGIDRAGLSEADGLTLDVLSATFDAAAGPAAFAFGTVNGIGGVNPYVLDQQASAFINLPDFFDSRHAIADFGDAEAYLERLRQVGAALDAEVARARADAAGGVAPPDFIIDKTLQALDGAIATPVNQQPYLTGLRRKLDAMIGAAAEARPRGEAIYSEAQAVMRDSIMPAHQRTAEFLRSIRANAASQAGVGRLAEGEAYYRAALRYYTTTDLTPDEVHQIGLDRVQEISAQADAALRTEGLTRGSVGERFAAITRDPRRRYPNTDAGRAQILADTRARIEEVQRRAPEWFAHLPRAPIEVRRMPPVVEAVQSAAYYEQPALDGSHPGVYYMTLRDMNAVSRVDLATVTYHEAAPGHHFQIALAQEQESIPLLRRLLILSAYVEGWALYGEQLVNEVGFYEEDNEGRVGWLRWQMWRAVRLVVDTGIHAKGWTRAQTIQYMQANLGDDPSIIANECDRYCAWPGQACAYELGRREIVRLRESARAALGERFDLRGFHDAVLLNGALPLTVLAAHVDRWAAAQRG